MLLNKQTATNIINIIKPIVDYDLNVINHTGLIVASTDTNRTNTYHEAAHILITNSLDEFVIDSDGCYRGCKQGINLPIFFEAQIVGVIGITGNPSEVTRYGKLLQRITEIILQNSFEVSENYLKEKDSLSFFDDLIHNNFNVSLVDIENWLYNNNLNPKELFTVAILQLCNAHLLPISPILHKTSTNVARKYIIDYLSLHKSLGLCNEEKVFIISNCSNRELNNILNQLTNELNSTYNIKSSCFIGNSYSNYLDIPKSFQEANSIFHYYKNQDCDIYSYGTIALDYILTQIPTIHRRNLHKTVFRKCNDEEIDTFRIFINEYFNCNGSLNQVADELYIHKNTVQYRISTIYKKTGFDLRKSHDLFVLYLSINI